MTTRHVTSARCAVRGKRGHPAPGSRWATALLAAASLVGCNPGAGKTAFVGATVYDGIGGAPILDAVIIVSGTTIEDIGTPDLVKVPRGATEIRLDGRYVVPGLIDAHTHAQRWALRTYLARGVTAVRQLGGIHDSVAALRDDVSSGSIPGPHMYISGAIIDGSPPIEESARAVTTETEARRAVDQATLIDASQVKIHTKIDQRLLEPLIDEAKTLNLPVTGHLGKIDALTAARMGVRSIEHLSGVVQTAGDPRALFRAYDDFARGFRAEALGWARLDSATIERTARALANADLAIVPTLVTWDAMSRLNDRSYISSITDMTGVPEAAGRPFDPATYVRMLGLTPADFAALRRARGKQDQFVRRFAAAGGLVVAGSDSPDPLFPPGTALLRELELLVGVGFTPKEALLAATRDAARLLEADSIGVLRAGNLADFIVVTRDPMTDIANLRAIERIVFKGASYATEDLLPEPPQ